MQFLPESGNAIVDKLNVIAFKAINEFGKPISVSGEILNQNHKVVTEFGSFHDGMGSFKFTPKNDTYFARITAPFFAKNLIKLPNILKKGTNFSVTETNTTYNIELFSNTEKNIKVIISNANKDLWQKNIILKNNVAKINIPKNKFLVGIHKIKLQNTQNNTIAERLIFTNRDLQLNVKVTTNKEIYNTREIVKVNIKTTNKNGQPIPSNLSISVADNKLVSFVNDKQNNILSSLLLSNELKGKIYNPSFYFDENEEKSILALDYLMLTHGWRNYIKNNTLTLKNAKYKPLLSTKKYGQVFTHFNKPIKAKVMIFDKESNKVLKINTNNKGEFEFDIEIGKSVTILTYNKSESYTYTKILNKKPIIIKDTLKPIQKNNIKVKDYLKKSTEKPFIEPIEEDVIIGDNNFNVDLESNGNSLDEIVITAQGIKKTARVLGYAVSSVRSKYIDEQNSTDIGNMLNGKIAGLEITNSANTNVNSNIIIRGSSNITGNSQVLFVIDGITFKNNNESNSILNAINPDNITNIQVLKGVSASSIYGTNGVNGVIIINTNKNDYNFKQTFNKRKKQKYNIKHYKNYIYQRSYHSNFYIPIYDSNQLPTNRTDFRQTIYWNPVVQTDKNGEANLEYYNSDDITSFIITTEGVGFNGLIGRNETKYATKKLLSINYKLPNYLVLNDTINLHIIIKNESDKELKSDFKIRLPKALKRINDTIDNVISIKANSFYVKKLDFIPIEKTKKAKIFIGVFNKNYSDVLEKEVTILSPFYPTKSSFSGHKDNNYSLKINDIANQSLNADLTIYTNIVAEVIEGMESLIREPHGCFEQVSATTYPNALILKYLRDYNKHDIKMERKARRFVRRGYKKLVAYETDKNGFEWYGRPRPILTLTALALMEFHALKEVYGHVDSKMIERTKKYIFSQKNGKGGFIKDKKEYYYIKDNNSRNAYIIYALSESGVTKGYEKEYQFAYNEALKSNDSYRMALMVNASYNYKKNEDAKKLIHLLKLNITKYGYNDLPIESTMTNSWGKSKYLETVALTVMALLKENKSELLISNSVNYLISNRKYGRFGSSQATSMSLKALIAFAKKQKERNIPKDSFVSLNINGEVITKLISKSDSGKIVFKNLEKYLIEGRQQINIQFSKKNIIFPYSFSANWNSKIPDTDHNCKLNIETILSNKKVNIGNNTRLLIKVKNKTDTVLPTGIAIVGIPSGTSVQMWQLKEIVEQKKADYFEIFDNYIVFYWNSFNQSEIKIINLDLKAEIAGYYQAPSSTTYLYYEDELKHWISGNKVIIR